MVVRQLGREADKGRLSKALQAQRFFLEVTLEQLTLSQMVIPGVDGGWSVKDIIAHITAWDIRGTLWIAAAGRGEQPEMPEPGKTWADLNAINAQTYAENLDKPLVDVLAAFEASWEPLQTVALAFSEQAINRPLTYFDGTQMQTMPAGQLIQWRYRHYRTHGEAIRTWISDRLHTLKE